MNDDITVRELELVAAILDALHKNWLEGISENDSEYTNGYVDGFTDSIDIVNDVLDKRGFDTNLPWLSKQED